MIQREHRDIPLELVDEPDAPTRLTFDMDELAALSVSIVEHGQLEPGGVVPRGDRFVVIYGHRRLLACKAANTESYSAYVYASDTQAMLGAQLAENVDRADLNPVEEAYWFAQLLDAIGGDTDELALALKKERDYVEGRLLLLQGDPKVLDALKAGTIGLGVAQLLNGYKNDSDRVVLLDAAIAGGASVRMVRMWLHDRKQLEIAQAGQAAIDPSVIPSAPYADGPAPLTCMFCDGTDQVYTMVNVWVHTPCLGHLQRILARHMGGAVHVEETKHAAASR